MIYFNSIKLTFYIFLESIIDYYYFKSKILTYELLISIDVKLFIYKLK